MVLITIIVVVAIVAMVVKTPSKEEKTLGRPSALPMNTARAMRKTNAWKRATKEREMKRQKEMSFM